MSNSLSQRVEDTLRYEFSGWIAQHPNAALWRVITGKVLADVRDALLSDEAVEAAAAPLTFLGHAGTRMPGTESVDVRAILTAAVDALSEDGEPA